MNVYLPGDSLAKETFEEFVVIQLLFSPFICQEKLLWSGDEKLRQSTLMSKLAALYGSLIRPAGWNFLLVIVLLPRMMS